MNILQVHNYYKQSGGEDKVLEQEKELIQNNGGHIRQFIKDNENINGLWGYLKVGLNTRYSKKVYKEFNAFLDAKSPDIVHVHNFFPLITPSIFNCTIEKKIPSVLTLHNYRLLHPNGLMLHNGEIDERSLKGNAYKCVLDGVYRNSIIQTAVVANMIEYHRKKRTWENKVDAFIALTDFARRKFIEGGIPADKIAVKPNFINDPFKIHPDLKRSSSPADYLFVGRISDEKGIKELVRNWMKYDIQQKLFIIGDGPLKKSLVEESSEFSNIIWLGMQTNEQVYKWLSKVNALVFPSICYENFPLTILEALSVGCPVICSNIGSQQSIVEDGCTGLHFEVSNGLDLVEKVEVMEREPELVHELGENARKDYEENYTPQKNYEMLMEIYKKVCS